MDKKPHVVIVGAGFGGIAAARALRDAPVDVTVIDKRNHHLFQPLLYQVATSALAPADVAQPIRGMLRHAKNIRVFMDEVIGVDRAARVVQTSSRDIPFDYLVVATGAQHSYFGKDEWAPFAPGLKSIDDAFVLRHKILGAFEKAEMEDDPKRRAALLDFVIIGAGPTGVEMAGAVAELARHSLVHDFRSISSECARIRLVDAGPRILSSFPEGLVSEAMKSLSNIGVEVITDTLVTDMAPGRVKIGDIWVETETVIWAAGVEASPAGRWLMADMDRSGRVLVDEWLRVPGDRRIFVIGDTASHTPEGADRALPGLAPVAKQMGSFVAGVIAKEASGGTAARSFRYRDWGSMATIGRNKAIADFGGLRLSGFLAWILWSLTHVAFLEGMKNRVSVGLSWAWSYLTWQRGARLIIGTGARAPTKEA